MSIPEGANAPSTTKYQYDTTGTLGTATDTVSYVYDTGSWGDLLKTFDGQAITYDGIGNPLTIGNRTFTWKHGRELATLTENGVTWANTYNADGLRISRTNGTLTYKYYYSGGQLVRIAIGNKYIDLSYDASGQPMSLYYSGYGVTAANYYYVTNLQGDVVAILNDAGTEVVTYTYDAWGNILDIGGTMADTLGVYNPLRYRGYVYDEETSLYYLQSRYYDPEVGRFINADVFVSTGQGILGNNMYTYCNNNSITYSDSSGKSLHPTTCVINDCGSGVSRSIVYDFIESVCRETNCTLDELGVDKSKLVSTTRYNRDVNVNAFVLGLVDPMFKTVGAPVANKYGVVAKLIISGLSFVAGGIAREIVYFEMPELPNGNYDVYVFDMLTSQTKYYNGGNGYTERIDAHWVRQIYVLTSPQGKLINYVECYDYSYTKTYTVCYGKE